MPIQMEGSAMKDCQGNELVSLFEKYERVFREKIKFYNEHKMRYDHYVRIDGTLMIITWRNCWCYTINDLEDPVTQVTQVSENLGYPKQEGAK